MPKWLIIVVTTALAGFLGFACGSLMTRPDRQEHKTALTKVKKLNTSLLDDNNALRHDVAKIQRQKQKQNTKAFRLSLGSFKTFLPLFEDFNARCKDIVQRPSGETVCSCYFDNKKANLAANFTIEKSRVMDITCFWHTGKSVQMLHQTIKCLHLLANLCEDWDRDMTPKLSEILSDFIIEVSSDADKSKDHEFFNNGIKCSIGWEPGLGAFMLHLSKKTPPKEIITYFKYSPVF